MCSVFEAAEFNFDNTSLLTSKLWYSGEKAKRSNNMYVCLLLGFQDHRIHIRYYFYPEIKTWYLGARKRTWSKNATWILNSRFPGSLNSIPTLVFPSLQNVGTCGMRRRFKWRRMQYACLPLGFRSRRIHFWYDFHARIKIMAFEGEDISTWNTIYL